MIARVDYRWSIDSSLDANTRGHLTMCVEDALAKVDWFCVTFTWTDYLEVE